MKIQIVSDLHLSVAPLDIPSVGADLLILAGDIHRPAEAISWAKKLPIPIVYVPGNHEYYGSSLPAADRLLSELSHNSNVTVLNCKELRIGAVRILGATLWTDFQANGSDPSRQKTMDDALQFSRDFTRINSDESGLERFSPMHCTTVFTRHLRWLEDQLAEPYPGTTVVITHFAPSLKSIAPRFTGSTLNACFVSDLDSVVRTSGAALWIHGHTHDSFDYQIGATRVLANPRGYAKDGRPENAAFDAGLTVEVGGEKL